MKVNQKSYTQEENWYFSTEITNKQMYKKTSPIKYGNVSTTTTNLWYFEIFFFSAISSPCWTDTEYGLADSLFYELCTVKNHLKIISTAIIQHCLVFSILVISIFRLLLFLINSKKLWYSVTHLPPPHSTFFTNVRNERAYMLLL